MNETPNRIHTISGKQIDPENVTASDIDIEDIAHGLSKVCRYSGQREQFISVAEHSVWVSRNVPAKLALHALLHDAAEAYMGDVPSPIKRLCDDFSSIERTFDNAVHERFGLSRLSKVQEVELKYWDKQSCIEEQLGHLDYLPYKKAYKLFMDRFKELTK